MDIHAYFSSVANPSKTWLSRVSDLVLAALVIAIIALMILPLPTILLDLLVALNISLGVMLVLMGIYVSKPLQFSAFPSVLLISTLFRLALSVATTRMILLHAELESKLHGSMDGAMKFVKGDAIAGIVIIIINLLGGLTVGIFQRGMEAGAAMSKYSILTIGDGMVAQIPALLSAMAAGLIVTRVTDTENDDHLGPGFPTGVFIVLGLLFATIGASLIPTIRKRMDKMSQPAMNSMFSGRQEQTEPTVDETALVEVKQSVPLLIELPAAFGAGGRDKELLAAVDSEFEKIQTQIGFSLPNIKFHWHKKAEPTWSFEMYEVPVLEQQIEPNTEVEQISDAVRESLRRHLTMFLGIQETGGLLAQASVDYPDIVKEALRSIPLQNVAEILRNLIEEEVSIRNVRGILESLVQSAAHEKDTGNLTEFVRIALARQICHQHAVNQNLNAIALEPSLEEKLLESVRASGGNRQLSLEPGQAESLRNALGVAIKKHNPNVRYTGSVV